MSYASTQKKSCVNKWEWSRSFAFIHLGHVGLVLTKQSQPHLYKDSFSRWSEDLVSRLSIQDSDSDNISFVCRGQQQHWHPAEQRTVYCAHTLGFLWQPVVVKIETGLIAVKSVSTEFTSEQTVTTDPSSFVNVKTAGYYKETSGQFLSHVYGNMKYVCVEAS